MNWSRTNSWYFLILNYFLPPLMYSKLLLTFACAQVVIPQKAIIENVLDPTYYTKDLPPENGGDAIEVRITLNKFVLLHMDQCEESISFSQEYLMSWRDPQLSWNASSLGYDNYDYDWIKVPEDDVWIPDVIFIDAMDTQDVVERTQRSVDLKFDGTVRQSTPSVVTVPCHLVLSDFPFDVQTCNVSIGSWMFDVSRIQVYSTVHTINVTHFTPGDLSEVQYTGNSEWELSHVNVFETVDSIVDDGNYSTVTFQVILKRKPVYYVLVIQWPTFIIGMVTIFGLFTPFSSRIERREKATLGLNMLLSISMMLTLVAEMLPKVERLPLLGNYIIAEVFLCAAGTITSIVILWAHNRSRLRKWHPPLCIRKFVLWEHAQIEEPDTERTSISMHSYGYDALSVEALKTDKINIFMEISHLQRRMSEVMYQVHEHCEELEQEEARSLLWTCIFDRIDIVCMVLFQIANVVVSVIFMK